MIDAVISLLFGCRHRRITRQTRDPYSVHTSTGFMRAVNNPIVDDDGSPASTFKRRVRADFLRREAPLFAALALVRYSIFGHYGYSNPYILAVCRRTVPKSSSRSDEFWRASQHRTPGWAGYARRFSNSSTVRVAVRRHKRLFGRT